MAKVSLKKVSKVYDDNYRAVKSVDLDIEDKEFIVLVGPSGCGKSTTLRMIAGLESISEGELFIGDDKVNGLTPKDRNIAMVFQSYALYPHMNVRENISFALKLSGMKKEDRYKKVDEVAKILQLERELNKKPSQLSGGQRQRVALGRAMVRQPSVFLLDEPLSNLDAKLRVSMRSELVSLHRQLNTTFIYVTHDQTEAMTMGDKIAVMSMGNVEQFDTPSNLYHNPKNLFVAEFIGSPQMNIFKGTLILKEGIGTLKIGDREIKLPKSINDRTLTQLKEYEKLDKTMEVLIGIRPEDIHFTKEIQGDNILEVKCNNVEQVGSDTFIYFNLPYSEKLNAARFNPPRIIKHDSVVNIKLDLEKIHIFDKQTENSILSQKEIEGI